MGFVLCGKKYTVIWLLLLRLWCKKKRKFSCSVCIEGVMLRVRENERIISKRFIKQREGED